MLFEIGSDVYAKNPLQVFGPLLMAKDISNKMNFMIWSYENIMLLSDILISWDRYHKSILLY